jgi:hypothetical protein
VRQIEIFSLVRFGEGLDGVERGVKTSLHSCSLSPRRRETFSTDREHAG